MRRKILKIRPVHFIKALCAGIHFPYQIEPDRALPADSKMISCWFEEDSNIEGGGMMFFLIESSEFPEVADGEPYSEFVPQIKILQPQIIQQPEKKSSLILPSQINFRGQGS